MTTGSQSKITMPPPRLLINGRSFKRMWEGLIKEKDQISPMRAILTFLHFKILLIEFYRTRNLNAIGKGKRKANEDEKLEMIEEIKDIAEEDEEELNDDMIGELLNDVEMDLDGDD